MPARNQFKTESEWLEHLRLWFAGLALAGMNAHPEMGNSRTDAQLASYAYKSADAMLEARKQEGGK